METGLETGFTLDLAHEWHSYNLIKENLWRRELKTYSRDRFGKDDAFFNKCHGENPGNTWQPTEALHITGVRDHANYLLPTITTDPVKASGRLYLGPMLKNIQLAVKDRPAPYR